MQNPWYELKQEIAKELNIDVSEIEEPDKFGDFAYPCFSLAKKLKKNPNEVAKDFEKLKIKFIKKIKAIGPYVNFYIDWSEFGNEILKSINKKYGSLNLGKNKKIMIEFCHANTHKAFHVGHVRNISLGEAISRILEFTGYRVIRTNYQGDIGPHVSKCIWGYLNLKEKEPRENKGKWLGEIYAKASKMIADKKLEDEVKKITSELYQEKNKKLMGIWKKTRKWSLDYLNNIYKRFDVKFDRLYFESEAAKIGIKKAKELLKKGIAKISEGATIVDLTKYNLGIAVILTKEGYPLYHAKDLGLAELEFGEYNPDKCIHVVGVEQKLYFEQLFKIFSFYVPEIAKRSYHLCYELVILKTGKMSSRLGEVVLFDDLFEKIYDIILKETKKRHPNWKKSNEVAEKITIATIKYGMLKKDTNTRVVFDWKEAMRFEGDTGPYLQYTYARANSILEKEKSKGFDASLLKDSKETLLIKLLAKYPDILEKSSKDLKPHYLASYLHDLSDAFNQFYQTLPVLKAEENMKNARLRLVEAVKIILESGLYLLSIPILKKM